MRTLLAEGTDVSAAAKATDLTRQTVCRNWRDPTEAEAALALGSVTTPAILRGQSRALGSPGAAALAPAN
ncbi:helix-turn-helix domain-containing protein [Methylobacterium oxalidis]|uniref:helix-turn-helix domain-containing protein n=1 Tax=Methylobacterium oxalidis TaxID=944322 RepID=UPI001EDF2513|nr:helix-turn-helix domain-containing protein [Methylobacterium oxalidis]